MSASAFLNIVAHQDDDLLFMNPDLGESIRAGARNITVYVTAGEAHFPPSAGEAVPLPGREACKSVNRTATGRPDGRTREQYADCRRRGIMAAYTQMLTRNVPADSRQSWEARLLPVGGGRFAEWYANLVDCNVSLVFLNLPENADNQIEGGPQALFRLWSDPTSVVRTVQSVNGPLGGRAFPYHRDALVRALAAVVNWARPTTIRSLDSHPDPRYQREWDYHDHTDHVMVGLFAQAACASSYCLDQRTSFVSVPYRGYNTASEPPNLSPSPRTKAKSSAFWTYAGFDSEVNVSNRHEYEAWLRRMHHRRPLGTTWAASDADAAVHVFAVMGHRLRVWRRASGGQWTGRDLSLPPGQTVPPGVTVCSSADGGVRAFVVGYDDRLGSIGMPPSVLSVRVGGNIEESPAWTNLGNPVRTVGISSSIGQPIACADDAGRAYVFVRSNDGRLNAIWERSPGTGQFGDWVCLGGAEVQQEPTVVRNNKGGLEVFAGAVSGGLAHWAQEANWFVPQPQPLPGRSAVCGSPTAVLGRDGTMEIFHRVAGAGYIKARTVDGSGHWHLPVPARHHGVGSIGVLPLRTGSAREGTVLLSARHTGGGVSVACWSRTAEPQAENWADLGCPAAGDPAVVADERGLPIVLAVGTDGRLHAAERNISASTPSSLAWRVISLE
ncbi:PIG-L family deacetylase [Streptomyces sp. NPDC091217]|uniref:PIG-L family deacetylase n=1 Tax=Streptomyces sp. NPDC091217 TaxID=3365975 RepID=UPI0038250729